MPKDLRKKAEHQRIYTFRCGAGKDSRESLGQQGDQTSQSSRKSTLNIHSILSQEKIYYLQIVSFIPDG